MTYNYISEIIHRFQKEYVNDLKTSNKSEDEIIKIIEDLDFDELFNNTLNNVVSDDLSYFESTMFEEVQKFQKSTDEIAEHLKNVWGNGFVAYTAMYILATEAIEAYGKYLDNLNEEDENYIMREQSKYTFVVLREIHGRACQIYFEILCLLQNGFADGAFARWRSMYELSVISSFIRENGEIVAKSFMEAADKNDRYDWAKCAQCFQINRYQKATYHISFNDIQKTTHFVEDAIWKQQYNLGNKIVHASPQGTFKRLGNREPDTIPAGQSDYGISIPAEHAAISLLHITSNLLTLIVYEDGIISMKYLEGWIDIIRKYFSIDIEEASNND